MQKYTQKKIYSFGIFENSINCHYQVQWIRVFLWAHVNFSTKVIREQLQKQYSLQLQSIQQVLFIKDQQRKKKKKHKPIELIAMRTHSMASSCTYLFFFLTISLLQDSHPWSRLSYQNFFISLNQLVLNILLVLQVTTNVVSMINTVL